MSSQFPGKRLFRNAFIIIQQKMLIMKKIFAILLLGLLLLLAGQAAASYWFQVVGISPVKMAPNSEANFTVTVKGLGSQGSYVQLLFKNVSQGLSIACPKMIKYVFPTGITSYNCSVKAGDIEPGNYSFVVDVAARGAPSGKKTAYVEVESAQIAPSAEGVASNEGQEPSPSTQTEQAAKGMPGPGAALAALAVMLASKRMMR